jgi:hypothetical protein
LREQAQTKWTSGVVEVMDWWDDDAGEGGRC